MTTTQYGKSLTIALAVILLLTTQTHKIPLIAPSKEQGKIIMNYILEHVLDDEVFLSGLLEVESVMKLKTQFTKNRLAWSHGSEVRVLSADASRVVGDINSAGKGLMGFGGDVVIVDEASLIPDLIMNKVLRMLGGSPNSRLILIGNPFNENYFYKASLDENFHKLKVTGEQAVREGRLTREFLDEMKKTLDPSMYTILYEPDFVIGTQGSYITMQDIETGRAGKHEDKTKRMGVDAARFGDDRWVFCYRDGSKVQYWTYKHIDSNDAFGYLFNFQKELGFKWEDVNVDGTGGYGAGLIDICKEKGYDVNEVNFAEAPDKNNENKFFNMRAQMYGAIKSALKAGNLDLNDVDLIKEVTTPKYMFRVKGRYTTILIEPKEDIKKRLGKSPDIADALALTYYEGVTFLIDNISYM